MEYVTYNEAGTLTGSYMQDLLPEHEGNHIEVTPELRAAWTAYRANDARNGLELLPPPVATLPTEGDYVTAVQAKLDATAQERNYDSILSACTYVGSTVDKFNAEGIALRNWRDVVWASCYELMAQVQAGTLAQPTVPGLIAMLPALTWPA